MSSIPRVPIVAAVAALLVALTLTPQAQQRPAAPETTVPLQPLAQQVRRLETALRYFGEPLPASEHQALNEAIGMTDEALAVTRIQQVLDRFALARVHISPESRVRVEQGAARPRLVQGGTRLFLVKVINEAGVTAPLTVASPNIGRVYIPSRNTPTARIELTDVHVKERWAEMSVITQPPMRPRLSGLGVEYAILQVYSRDRGQRSAIVGFNVGQGSQDIGFRNDVDILFTALPAHPVRVRVADEHGQPTTAAFLVKDAADRIYPTASKRLAPDFYFQPQVYRRDGQTLDLPSGSFTLTVSRGPEYVAETRRLALAGPDEWAFQLRRWIDPSRY